MVSSHHPESAHAEMSAPSAWVARFADLVPAGGTVLDVAAGGGRHSACSWGGAIRLSRLTERRQAWWILPPTRAST